MNDLSSSIDELQAKIKELTELVESLSDKGVSAHHLINEIEEKRQELKFLTSLLTSRHIEI